jgi:hypothetical protein
MTTHKAAQPNYPNWMIIALAISLLLTLLFTSCSPAKRLDRLARNHTPAAAVVCHKYFPILESSDTVTVTDTALLDAYEQEFAYLSHLLDSLLTSGCDTITIERIRELKVQLPSKPCPEKVVTVTKESTARLQVVRDSCNAVAVGLRSQIATANVTVSKATALQLKAESKVKALRKQRNTWLWLFILLAVWTVRKPIFSLITKIRL